MGTEAELSPELLAEFLTNANEFANWLMGDSSLDELIERADGGEDVEDLHLDLVDSEGGFEGGGETVVRVIKVSRGSEVLCHLRFGGWYSSYVGIEWESDVEFVTPREVQVTMYFNAKELKQREANHE